jgi:hypothetical protein
VLIVLGLARPAAGAEATPPALEFAVTTSATGTCRMEGAGVNAAGGDSTAVTLSGVSRYGLPFKGWYYSAGAQAENYFFAANPAWPRRLQDYAALVSLEYFEGAENVAALTVRPGWYFENHPAAAAWDVPVDLTIGFPVRPALDGVAGFSNARFYHHALPVLGLIWTINPQWRIELVYPEPAMVVTFGPAMSLRLGGELIGAGFLSDARPVRTPIEYESYRVGAEWSDAGPAGLKFALGAGVEAERDFDFFRQENRLHGSGAGYLKISASYSR